MMPLVQGRVRQQAMPLPWSRQGLPDRVRPALYPGIDRHADQAAGTLLDTTPRKGIHRILLFLPDHSGPDLILLSPLLAALHRDYPGAQVDAVVTGGGVGLLFADYPNFGRAFELPRPAWLHPWSYLRLARTVRRERYDLAIEHVLEQEASRPPLLRYTASRRVRIQ